MKPPGNSTNRRLVQPVTGLETVRRTVFEVSKSIKGLDEWAWPTYCEQSVTTDRQVRSEKENDTLCTKIGELTGQARLTQCLQGCRSAGRQDEPKPTLFVIYMERVSPALSPG